MMKKIIIIFLLFIYTATAFGIAINYHYCGGHLSGVKVLNFGGNGGCKCNPANMPKDCCKDKMLYFKGDNHKSSTVSVIVLPGSFAIDVPVTTNTLLLHKEFCIPAVLTFGFVRQKSPQPLFLINNVFRI
jgi:hypothetical protein